MPVVQVATAPASEAFVSDPGSFLVSTGGLSTVDGYKGSFYGLQVEDKKTGYFISVWESLEHRQRLVGDPAYAEIMGKLKGAMVDPTAMKRDHINVSVDFNPAFSAPAVEYGILTLKPGQSADKLASLGVELVKMLDAAAGVHAPTLWGQSIEDGNKFLLVVGWDSLEAHQAAVSGGSFSGIISQLTEIAELSVKHAHMKKNA